MSKEIFNKEIERLENLNNILDAHKLLVMHSEVVLEAIDQKIESPFLYNLCLRDLFINLATPFSFVKMIREETEDSGARNYCYKTDKFCSVVYNKGLTSIYGNKMSQEEKEMASKFVNGWINSMRNGTFDLQIFLKSYLSDLKDLIIFVQHAVKNELVKDQNTLIFAQEAVDNFKSMAKEVNKRINKKQAA